MKQTVAIIFIFIITLTTVIKSLGTPLPVQDNTKDSLMIFISHCYYWYNYETIDKRIELLDLNKYNKIFLGGDILGNGALNNKSLAYLDSIFNIKDKNTFWSFGNHDLRNLPNGNIETYKKYCNKNSFYAMYDKGFTYLILNTNIDSCYTNNDTIKKEYEEQLHLIDTICDTISKSHYLIILSHNIVWYNMDSISYKYAHTNGSSTLFYKNDSSFFENTIYPKLKKVREKGIKILWLAGDAGKWGKGKIFKTKEGVVFASNGIGNSRYDWLPDKLMKRDFDKVLVMKYNTEKDSIELNYEELNFLIYLQQINKNGIQNAFDSLVTEIYLYKKNKNKIIKNYKKMIESSSTKISATKEKARRQNRTYQEQLIIYATFLYNKSLKDKFYSHKYDFFKLTINKELTNYISKTKQ